MIAGVRMFYKGFFTFGIDGTVINSTKDRVWIREAALSNYAGIRSPDPQWMIQNMYGGKIPTELPKQKYTVAGNQEQAVRDLEIDPALFTPKDQMRQWVREWPQNVSVKDVLGAPSGGSQPK
jgi:ribonuclease Z